MFEKNFTTFFLFFGTYEEAWSTTALIKGLIMLASLEWAKDIDFCKCISFLFVPGFYPMLSFYQSNKNSLSFIYMFLLSKRTLLWSSINYSLNKTTYSFRMAFSSSHLNLLLVRSHLPEAMKWWKLQDKKMQPRNHEHCGLAMNTEHCDTTWPRYRSTTPTSTVDIWLSIVSVRSRFFVYFNKI